MSLIGKKIEHEKFGTGIVLEQNDTNIKVQFSDCEKELGLVIAIKLINAEKNIMQEMQDIVNKALEKQKEEVMAQREKFEKEMKIRQESNKRKNAIKICKEYCRKDRRPNPRRIIFCNIAWYEKYDGTEKNANTGGMYVVKNVFGHEKANFKVINGRCYGFVQNKDQGQLDLERIANGGLRTDELTDVLVVWTAKKEDVGTVIVGFYENAIVNRNIKRNNIDDSLDGYYFEVLEKDAYLIPPNQRNFCVPRAKEIKGGMGQSNVWYADSINPLIEQFVNNSIKYFEDYKKENKNENIRK